MRMLFQLVKRGWRVVTEVHTTHWLIVDVLGALIPSSILTAIVAFFGEHSVAALATVFFLALAASALVVIATLGYRQEKAPPARAPGGGGGFRSWKPQLGRMSERDTGQWRSSQRLLATPATRFSLGIATL